MAGRQWHDDMHTLAAGDHRKAAEADVGEVLAQVHRRIAHFREIEPLIRIEIEHHPVRLLDRAEYLVVATASPVALASIRRAAGLLNRLKAPVVGVVENMTRKERTVVADLASAYGHPLLGQVPYDPDLEDAFGDVEKLRASEAFRAVAALPLH